MIETVREFFLALRDEAGINLTIFHDAFDFSRFVEGLSTTFQLVAICTVTSILVGGLGAVVISISSGPLAMLVRAYVAVIRNTPLLIQMYFFFFGIGSLLPTGTNAIGMPEPLVGNFAWAVIALTLYTGAFNVESFRAGIGAVHDSYEEAALALGYSRLQAFRHVVLPLGVRFSFASLSNNLVDLAKATTVAYAIGVAELLYVSNQIWSDSLNTLEMMNVILVVYLAITGLVVLVINRVQRLTELPGFGAN